MRPRGAVTGHGPMVDAGVERFLEDGFVRIEGAFAPRVAEHAIRRGLDEPPADLA
ncbi:hypothetical protein ACWGDT_05025 [Streptomyces avermitilis]